MPTNKINLRSAEQFMEDYVPIHSPLYTLFLGKSQAHPAEVGKFDFNRVQTVGDIRAKHVTPKDTEIRQIAAMEGIKTYKRYFLANQYVHSHMQDRHGIEDVTKQVLDEHQKQMDDLFLLGEGTSDSTMLNNGLFWSNDPNHTTESSVEVKKNGTNYAAGLYTRVMTNAQKANQVAGRKVVIFYGSDIIPHYNSIFPEGNAPFKKVMQEGLGSNYSLIDMPEAVTPSSSHGWIIANLDHCKLHYSVLPKLLAQGENEEKMYYWSNFLLGSCMLEVLALNGVIKQPATLEA